MAENTLFDNEIVPVNSLDIFDKGKMTYSILDTYDFKMVPSLPYSEATPVIFEIHGQSNAFLSPNFFIDVVYVVKKVSTATDGTETVSELAASDKVTLESLPFHTLWSTVQIAINDVIINNKNNLYPYLANLDRYHLTTEQEHQIHSALELGSINDGGTTTFYTGTKPDERRGLITGDMELFLRGKPVLPILKQPRYFPPSCKITLSLTQTKPSYRIIADSSVTYDVKFQMKSIHLIGHRLIPNAQLLLDTMSALRTMPAQYPITRFEPQLFEIPTGTKTCEKLLTLPTSKVPRMVFLSSFDTSGVYGQKSKTLFRTKTSNMTRVYISIEGQKYPNDEYNGTTREGMLKVYSDYKQNTSQLMKGKQNFLDWDRFKQDFFWFSINLDRFHGTERSLSDAAPDTLTPERTGSCTLHIELASNAIKAQPIIAVLVYNDTITIDDSLVPHSNM